MIVALPGLFSYFFWLKTMVNFFTQGEFTDNTRIQTNSQHYHGIIRAIKTYLKEFKINVCH